MGCHTGFIEPRSSHERARLRSLFSFFICFSCPLIQLSHPIFFFVFLFKRDKNEGYSIFDAYEDDPTQSFFPLLTIDYCKKKDDNEEALLSMNETQEKREFPYNLENKKSNNNKKIK